jgi:hypothetical protein
MSLALTTTHENTAIFRGVSGRFLLVLRECSDTASFETQGRVRWGIGTSAFAHASTRHTRASSSTTIVVSQGAKSPIDPSVAWGVSLPRGRMVSSDSLPR